MVRKASPSDIDRLRAENEHLLEARRLAEELHDRFVELFDFAPLAYVTLDGVGTIRQANEAAAAMLGANERRGHLVGTRLKRLLQEPDHRTLAAYLRACPASTQPLSCEVRLRDSTPVQLWSRRIRPGLRLYPTVVIDLSDRERAANEARRLGEAEKAARAASEAKDHFIAILSHELRTPLTPVLAAVTALHGRNDLPDNLRNICEMIRRNVVTEARLIDDLLDVTRITQRKMRVERRPMDVHDSARDVLETLNNEIEAKQLSVLVSLEATHHCAAADPLRLKQVFWNLVRNAVKFTPEGGTLEVRSWNSALDGKRWLHVEVSDTGVGFNADAGPKLFEPFEQGSDVLQRSGGLGLGLAICKGVMELHGGKITALSRGSGLGARFVIDIETTDDVPRAVEAPPVAAPLNVRPRILLVEDDEDTAIMIAELLDEAGYQVRSARSAKAALATDFGTIDLMISDIGLPDISGLELMRSIRQDHQIKAVALSGYGTEADIRASTDAGFNAHLTKPVDFADLLAAIREVSV